MKKKREDEAMAVTAKAKLIRFTENPEGTIALASKLCYSSLDMDSLIERIEGGDNAQNYEPSFAVRTRVVYFFD